LANLGLFPRDFAFHKREMSRCEPSIQYSRVGQAGRRSSIYWRSVQPCWTAEKAFRLDAKAVLKIVGEFLKPVATESRLASPFPQ
jgi:hypothetical protein